MFITAHSSLPSQRAAGVGMHFTSLPGRFGIGDIGSSALGFLDTLVQMGMRVWQFLPTGPTAYGDSPYQPLSAFAGNENLIGITPLVHEGLLRPNEIEALGEMPRDIVDYGRLVPIKNELLATAAQRFERLAGVGLKQRFDDFLEHYDSAWLDDYAVFRILKTAHGERPWSEWDPMFVHREARAIAQFRQRHNTAIQRVKVLQFLFWHQWQTLHAQARDRGIFLFADMPFYIALDSSDAWAHPEMLRVDGEGRPSEVAGVPPDYFSADGQLWGNPVYDWAFHEEQGFQWWIERLRYAAHMSDLVRIDHFRGFEAYWSVQFGARTAREGSWRPGPGEKLFDALAEAMQDLPIVAEDLGVITPEVDKLRKRYGIPGMVVLQFEVSDPDFSVEHIDENSVCYTGTHDNDTTLGWFRGGHGDTRSPAEVAATQSAALNATQGRDESIHLDMIRLAFSTPSRLAIAPMQDYLGLGSESRFNIPGTTGDNWRWRVRSNQLNEPFFDQIHAMVTDAGRR